MSKKLQALKDSEQEIYVIGASQDLICTALSLLWSLGRSPTALIGEGEGMQDSDTYGIPVLPLNAALAGKVSPTILLCSYEKVQIEKLVAKAENISAGPPVFWLPYDIERAYIEKKHSAVSVPKVEMLIGADIFPCGVLSRYRCFVERDYERMVEDIKQTASHAQAIKYLEIRTPSSLIDHEFVSFLKKIYVIDNVFSVTIRTDPYHKIYSDVLKELEQFILKIDFYNYPETSNNIKASFEGLAGHIPFSITERSIYPPQTVGYDERPLTIERLNKLIAEDLGVDIPNNSTDDREICFVNVSGGLGNQILAYLVACFVSENASKLIVIDDTQNHIIASNHEAGVKITRMASGLSQDNVMKAFPNHFAESAFLFERLELYENFPCEFRLFSELFSDSVRDILLKKLEQYACAAPLFSYLSTLNCKMTYYSDRYDYKRQLMNAKNHISIDRYYTDDARLSSSIWLTAPMKNSYYAQIYFTNFRLWDKANREWAKSKLKFPKFEDEYNQNIATQIMGCDSVVIHVRRRDLRSVNSNCNVQYTAYFKAAICAVKHLTEYSAKKYFVFSDDVEWCQAHEEEVGLDLISDDITYVDQNIGKSSFRDMHLMSMGKIMIFPPCSSFSFCAFILSATVEKYVSFQQYKKLCLSEISEEKRLSQLPQSAW